MIPVYRVEFTREQTTAFGATHTVKNVVGALEPVTWVDLGVDLGWHGI